METFCSILQATEQAIGELRYTLYDVAVLTYGEENKNVNTSLCPRHADMEGQHR